MTRPSCSICGSTIAEGRPLDAWDWEGQSVVVHPDCWRVFQGRDICEWDTSDTWRETLTYLTPGEVAEEIAACVDPDVAEQIERYGGGDYETDAGQGDPEPAP